MSFAHEHNSLSCSGWSKSSGNLGEFSFSCCCTTAKKLDSNIEFYVQQPSRHTSQYMREFGEQSRRDDLIDILANKPKLFMSDFPSGFYLSNSKQENRAGNTALQTTDLLSVTEVTARTTVAGYSLLASSTSKWHAATKPKHKMTVWNKHYAFRYSQQWLVLRHIQFLSILDLHMKLAQTKGEFIFYCQN